MDWQEVTDPALLDQLNAPTGGLRPPRLKKEEEIWEPVSDPAVLDMLENNGPLPLKEPKRIPPIYSPSVQQHIEQGEKKLKRAGLPTDGSIDTIPPPPPPPAPQLTDMGDFANEFLRSAGQQNLHMLSQSALLTFDLTGDEMYKSFADSLEKASKQAGQNIKKRTAPSFTQAKTVGELIDAAQASIGQGMGSYIAPILGGVMGTLGGKSLIGGKAGGRIGGAFGAFTGSASLNLGEMREELVEIGVKDPQVRGKAALAGGSIMAALDALPAESVLAKIMGTGARQKIKRALAKRLAQEMARGAVFEGSTEGLQELVQMVTASRAADKPIQPEELVDRMVNAFIGGALPGGTMRGITALPSDLVREDRAPSQPLQSEVGEVATDGAERTIPIRPGPTPQFPSPPQPPPGSIPGELSLVEQVSILQQMGYADDQIREMAEEERSATAEEGRKAGVTPIDGPPPARPETAQERPVTETATPPQPAPEPPPPPEGYSLYTEPEEVRGTRSKPQKVEVAEDLEKARVVANTEPTEKQAAANNYQHGHIKLHNFDISIENPKGSIRKGKSEDGTDYESVMPADYGYLKMSRGRDDDHVDVYIGDHPESTRIFVIDQTPKPGGRYSDEVKVVFGTNEEVEAVDIYHRSFSDGQGVDRIGAITETTPELLDRWRKIGNPKVRFSRQKRFHTKVSGENLSTETVEKNPVTITDGVEITAEITSQPTETPPVEPPTAPKKPKGYKPQSFTQFVIAGGGIRDVTGELKAMDAHKVPRLVTKNGRTPDEWRELAVEAGYLSDPGRDFGGQSQTTSQDVYNLLSEERAGRRHYQSRDLPEADRREAQAQARVKPEVPTEFEKLGPFLYEFFQKNPALRPSDFHHEDLMRAKEILEGNPLEDVGEVLERIAIEAEVEDYQPANDQQLSELPDPFIEEVPDATAGTISEAQPQAPSRSEEDQRPAGEEDRPEEYEAVPRPSLGEPQPEQADETVTTEETEAGTQTVFPGTEKISEAKLAQRQADKPLKAKTAQKPADEGLLGDEKDQTDLIDRLRKPDVLTAAPQIKTDTPEFKAWFRQSKVVDGQGNPKAVYHGSQRLDRVTARGRFDKRRATSGPMAFFTDSTEIASNYSNNKADTSFEHPDHYKHWFKFKPKGIRSSVDIVQAWHFLTSEQRQTISEKLPHVVSYDAEGNELDSGKYRLGGKNEYGLSGKDHWDWTIRQENRGNVLGAAVDIWLNGGTLINSEEEFMTILRLGGMPMENVRFDSPWATYPGVVPVYLSIQNPLDAGNIPQNVIDALGRASRRTRKRARDQWGDIWHKENRDPRSWFEEMAKNVAEGKNTHAWTSIPDWVTNTLQRLGYDGIKDKGGKMGGQTHTVWIPFEETQVKSPFNRGTFDPSDPRILYSAPERGPIFYSGLIKAVEGLKQPKASPAQWMNTIRNAPGVKKEELDWIGLEDWFAKQSGPISKDALLDFLRANQVNVQEVVKGGGTSRIGFSFGNMRPIGPGEKNITAVAGGKEYKFKLQWPDEEDGENLWGLYDEQGKGIEVWHYEPDHPELEATIRKHLDLENNLRHSGTEFETYTLPGGENYRELLLTLPERKLSELGFGEDKRQELSELERIPHAITEAQQRRLAELRSDLSVARQTTTPFTGSHWREPNVLLHVRFNERTDADGKKVLFVEEIQSDWHQKGRRQGYKTSADVAKVKARQEAFDAFRKQLQEKYGAAFWGKQTREETEKYDELNQGTEDLKGLPDAPFKTSWPELGMKRMVRWAAENGFERIAWTPGEVQAERYDLSKHLDSVMVERRPQAMWRDENSPDYGLTAWGKTGRIVIPQGSNILIVSQRTLPDYIGKDLADKAIQYLHDHPNEDNAYFKGLDLKVGGEGMKGFYDKMLVDVGNKLGKKFGAKVGHTKIFKGNIAEWEPIIDDAGMWRIQSNRDKYTYSDTFETKEEAEAFLREGSIPVPSLDITPAMRDAAMGGQPLFRNKGKPATRNTYQFSITDKQREHLKSRVRSIAQRILGRTLPTIEFHDTLPGGFEGAFVPDEWTMVLALQSATDPRLLVRHEAIHVLKRSSVFTDGEWRVLERLAKRKWIDQYKIRARYEHYDGKRPNYEDLVAEEAIAEAYLEFAAHGPQHTAADTIFAKLKRFLEAVMNMLRGDGFTSIDSLFEKIESGEVARRAEKKRQPIAIGEEAEVLTAAQPPDDSWAPGEAAVTTKGPKPTEFENNINLDHIAAPDDVKEVITTVGKQAEEFITERRGVVSNEQTKALAQELGMTAKDLLKRQRGQSFNAHELYAARVLMMQSATTVRNLASKAAKSRSLHDLAQFQKAFTRHVAIQEQIAGMTAEAGRALQQFKMMAGANYLPIARAMQDEARAKDKTARVGEKKKVGSDALVHLAEMVNALDDPTQLNRFTRDAFKITLWDKVRELWINALLSGPRTHATNIRSNLLTGLGQVPETAVAATLGALHGGEKVRAGEATARIVGLIEGTKEGMAKAIVAFKTGEPSDAMSKIEHHRRKAIGGMTGEIVRIPSKALLAEDEFFKTISYRSEINARAVRIAVSEGKSGRELAERIAELRANPTPSMQQGAHEFALYQTFQNTLGPIGRMAMRLRDTVSGAYLLLPFIKTPANLIKYAAERTPFGLLMREVRENLSGKHGNIARDTQAARLMLGSALAGVVASYALSGILSGSGPDDPEKRALMRSNGWQPYSIKIGDSWYAYQRVDPFGFIMGVTADLIELGDAVSDADASKAGAMVVHAISRNLLNKTWLSGLSDFIEAVQDPGRYGERYLQKMGGTIVPTGMAQVAQEFDPVMREIDGLMDMLKTRVPGQGKSLPARRDIFGEVIQREGSFGPNLLSPIYMSKDKDDPVIKAMLEVDYIPHMPSRRINGHQLTAGQYEEYAELSGKEAKRQLDSRIRGKRWAVIKPDDKIDIIKKAFDGARDIARRKMKRKYPDLAKSAK